MPSATTETDLSIYVQIHIHIVIYYYYYMSAEDIQHGFLFFILTKYRQFYLSFLSFLLLLAVFLFLIFLLYLKREKQMFLINNLNDSRVCKREKNKRKINKYKPKEVKKTTGIKKKEKIIQNCFLSFYSFAIIFFLFICYLLNFALHLFIRALLIPFLLLLLLESFYNILWALQ